MVLNAHACQPRLRLTAAAHKGRLIAGQQNWLGLALQPLHDELVGLRVHAAPAPPATTDPWAASASTPSHHQDSRQASLCTVLIHQKQDMGRICRKKQTGNHAITTACAWTPDTQRQ